MQAPVERPRYSKTLHHVPKAMSELLSSYSGIPKDDQISHITRLRDAGYAQYPYPCMGTFRFLDLDLARHEAYKEHVLGPLCEPLTPGKPEPLFLDCGCCLGQELRKLAADGVPPHRLWASDIEPKFIDLGFELFRDGDKLPRDHFLCPGNVIVEDWPGDQLATLDDRVTILNISAVFHLFGLEEHKRIVDRCLRLLRKDTGGPVLVLGAHAGSRDLAGPQHLFRGDRRMCLHSGESWEALWREVCEQPQWKDKIAAVEVKAKMFARIRNEGPEADDIITLSGTDWEKEGNPLQMFQVWVTFKSDS
ncbi:hypothetical protein RRF57_010186 [Xylaria bambusicola]|uniref:Methyltransferase domain-containing protein n=1 Tax=Xylaria bambusicola TaxID=326684 RepID=A0AAN7UW93_9PEZI